MTHPLVVNSNEVNKIEQQSKNNSVEVKKEVTKTTNSATATGESSEVLGNNKLEAGEEEKKEEQQQQAAAKTVSKASIIVVSRGAREGDPPLWTIVNNSTPMNSAVNVITGTRITHGHPLLIG